MTETAALAATTGGGSAWWDAASLVSQGAGSAIEAWLNYKMMQRQEQIAARESEKNRDVQRLGLATGIAKSKAEERRSDAERSRLRIRFGRAFARSMSLYGGPNVGTGSFGPGAMRAIPSGVATPGEIGQVAAGLRRVS